MRGRAAPHMKCRLLPARRGPEAAHLRAQVLELHHGALAQAVGAERGRVLGQRLARLLTGLGGQREALTAHIIFFVLLGKSLLELQHRRLWRAGPRVLRIELVAEAGGHCPQPHLRVDADIGYLLPTPRCDANRHHDCCDCWPHNAHCQVRGAIVQRRCKLSRQGSHQWDWCTMCCCSRSTPFSLAMLPSTRRQVPARSRERVTRRKAVPPRPRGVEILFGR